jgi:type IV secretory pathway VirB3-like protein
MVWQLSQRPDTAAMAGQEKTTTSAAAVNIMVKVNTVFFIYNTSLYLVIRELLFVIRQLPSANNTRSPLLTAYLIPHLLCSKRRVRISLSSLFTNKKSHDDISSPFPG